MIKPRYLWQYIGSNIVINQPYNDYIIIDTIEDKIIESYDSPSMIKFRLKELNKK